MERDTFPFLTIPEPPRALTRQGRVELFIEFHTALREGRMPSDESRIFVTSASLNWLRDGGNFFRDFLKIGCERGHRETAQQIFRSVNNRDFGEDEK